MKTFRREITMPIRYQGTVILPDIFRRVFHNYSSSFPTGPVLNALSSLIHSGIQSSFRFFFFFVLSNNCCLHDFQTASEHFVFSIEISFSFSQNSTISSCRSSTQKGAAWDNLCPRL